MNSIVYVFGPSCSGKSTLTKALQSDLGDSWKVIDRDDLIEQGICTELTANSLLETKVTELHKQVIIDAQIPWRKKKLNEFYFLILPPLEILLERDTQRTARLNRSEKQAFWAKDYVIETHHLLSRMEKSEFDHCWESTSIEEEVTRIKTLLKAQDFFIQEEH
jgi:adenylate kinase family enzyme